MLIAVDTGNGDTQIYDYSAGAASWTSIASIQGYRRNGQSASLGGQFYIFGSGEPSPLASVISYNYSEDQWTDVGNLIIPRTVHGVTVVPQKLIANYCLGQPISSYSVTFKPNTTDTPILSHLNQYLTPEAVISLSFNLFPSLCLSLMRLFMTILAFLQYTRTKKNEIPVLQKFIFSTLLALIPI